MGLAKGEFKYDVCSMNLKMKKLYFLALIIFCFGTEVVKAQFPDIFTFNDTTGQNPIGSLTLYNGKLYGMTSFGGSVGNNGSIFSLDMSGKGYKILYNFNGVNGMHPQGSLTIFGSVMYGMTYYGGTHDSGCIFSIDTNGNTYKDLHDFNNKQGAYPFGSLTYSMGVLYGMTEYGGANNVGCIFSIDTSGSKFKDMLDFSGFTNGSMPYGSLTLSDGKLFGMTNQGSGYNDGCIFKIDTNGSGYKNLFAFNGISRNPIGSLTVSGSKLFGMTNMGGPFLAGDIFTIDTSGNNYKQLYYFNGPGTYGIYPWGDLTLIGNRLYGMTSEGGAKDSGCVFSIDTNGTNVKDLLDFNHAIGCSPYGDLTLSGSALYGMTPYGGKHNSGVIFEIDTNSVAGINQPEQNLGGVKLFPNPNNGRFAIASSGVSARPDESFGWGQATVEIYNIIGEKVYSKQWTMNNGQLTIDLSDNENGIYMYRVVSANGELTGVGKFIIQE
jgi:uncharacterized repeat protein (TIGR03803 family)